MIFSKAGFHLKADSVKHLPWAEPAPVPPSSTPNASNSGGAVKTPMSPSIAATAWQIARQPDSRNGLLQAASSRPETAAGKLDFF